MPTLKTSRTQIETSDQKDFKTVLKKTIKRSSLFLEQFSMVYMIYELVK